MKKKLTLVSFMCRRKIVTKFVMARLEDGKTTVSNDLINRLFNQFWGFSPQRGETISFL